MVSFTLRARLLVAGHSQRGLSRKYRIPQALPPRLRKYVGTWPGSVNRKWSVRREILDWVRYRGASPSLRELRDDLALAHAMLSLVEIAGEEGRRRAARRGGSVQ
jgi:hypothetical protein